MKLTNEQRKQAIDGCPFNVRNHCVQKDRHNSYCHCVVSYKRKLKIKNKTLAKVNKIAENP